MYKSENLLVLHLTTLAVHCPTCLNYMDIAAKCPTMRPVSAEEALLDYFVPFPATTTTPSSSSSSSYASSNVKWRSGIPISFLNVRSRSQQRLHAWQVARTHRQVQRREKARHVAFVLESTTMRGANGSMASHSLGSLSCGS